MSSSSKFLIDSHIHLFRDEHLSSLAWMTSGNPLNRQHSIGEYLSSVSQNNATRRRPLGFVFVETDRKCHLVDDSGWKCPLEEFEFVYKAGTGQDPRYRGVARTVLGIVPWAPLPKGRGAMQRYKAQLGGIAGERDERAKIRLLKGFRYLLQSHPSGVMLDEAFIDSLKWMGEEGYVFELTVDCRGVGLWQLEESVELLKRAHDGAPENKKLRLIIGMYFTILSHFLYIIILTRVHEDHLAKPDLHVVPKDLATNPFFNTWKTHLRSIAASPNTYIKLSGVFSELPPSLLEQQCRDREEWLTTILEYVQPWVFAAIDIFGTKRVIWGSDWPVCTINGGKEKAWGLWVEITDRLLEARQLNELEKENIWWGNALKAYQIEVEGELQTSMVGSHI